MNKIITGTFMYIGVGVVAMGLAKKAFEFVLKKGFEGGVKEGWIDVNDDDEIIIRRRNKELYFGAREEKKHD